jgi:CRP/FNR family transcriptional regulator
MLSPEQYKRIASRLSPLPTSETNLLRELQELAYFAVIPAGREILGEGERVTAIAILLSGMVRVYKIGETGREMTLYRFGSGESCILSANAVLSQEDFSAIAVVEEDAEAVMIPSETLRQWVSRYDFWREFVFKLLSQRLSSLMEIVDEVAFRRLDIRIATLLLSRSQSQKTLAITHQEIAAELGSSREVVSRVLENLAKQNLIRLGRGSIEIPDAARLNDFLLR